MERTDPAIDLKGMAGWPGPLDFSAPGEPRYVAILSLLAVGVAAFASIAPAAASDDYPYCLQGWQTGYPGDCSYQSYSQCQTTASGRAAACGINPRVAFQSQRQQGPDYTPRSRSDGGFYSPN